MGSGRKLCRGMVLKTSPLVFWYGLILERFLQSFPSLTPLLVLRDQIAVIVLQGQLGLGGLVQRVATEVGQRHHAGSSRLAAYLVGKKISLETRYFYILQSSSTKIIFTVALGQANPNPNYRAFDGHG